MPHATTRDANALQHDLRAYLRAVDRAGDTERIAQRLARKHSLGSRVVGFRRRGYEVLLHEERTDDVDDVLGIYDIEADGQLLRAGTVWNGRDLERWVDRHHHFLEWVRSDLRPEPAQHRRLTSPSRERIGERWR